MVGRRYRPVPPHGIIVARSGATAVALALAVAATRYGSAVSEASTAVVCLDADDPDGTARRAVAFLLAEQVMTSHPTPDEPMACEWVPGPKADSVLEDRERLPFWQDLAGVGVDIDRERDLHYAMENYEAPRCLGCGTGMDDDTYFALLEQWLGGPEPTVGCPACAGTALLGDWPSEWPSAVGCPAVVFANWPPLSSAFLDRLRAVLGGRTVVVRAHF